MDEREVRRIQEEAAEALLNIGVSIPLKEVKLPFRNRPLRLRVTMKRPSMSGQIEIARTYLSMGVSADDIERMGKDDDMAFIAKHGWKISRMIALTICRGWLSRKLLLGVMSWVIRNFVDWEYQVCAMQEYVMLMGTKSFMSIIRSAEMTNPMKLRLSQVKKGS